MNLKINLTKSDIADIREKVCESMAKFYDKSNGPWGLECSFCYAESMRVDLLPEHLPTCSGLKLLALLDDVEKAV